MDQKEDAKHEAKESAHTTHSKRTLIRSVLVTALWFLAFIVGSSLLIHFTNLRYRVAFDPIGAVIAKVNPPERANGIRQANYHISESERLVAEVKQHGESKAEGHGAGSQTQAYKNMVWNNDMATSYMLEAEAKGADLKKEGLIKRLCDTLREQYVLITGKDPSTINESETLNARVNNGEDLQTVFNQIQEQLKTAMAW